MYQWERTQKAILDYDLDVVTHQKQGLETVIAKINRELLEHKTDAEKVMAIQKIIWGLRQ